MRKTSRLTRRGAIYYFRGTVPKDLVQIFRRKEITRSLQTPDFGKAKQLCSIECVKFDAFCQAMRGKQAEKTAAGEGLSEEEISTLVSRYFIEQEQISEKWAFQDLRDYDEADREHAMDGLKADTRALFYPRLTDEPSDEPAIKLARDFLGRNGELEVDEKGEDFQRLAQLLRQAQLENLNRRITRLEGKPVVPFDHAFKDLTARTPVPALPKRSITLRKLTDRFMAHKRKTTGENTPVTFNIPVRILLEVLGEDKPITEISRDDIRSVGEEMERIPSHVSQKYPKMKLMDAIKKADEEGNETRLSKASVSKYYDGLSGIFNWAVEEELISEAPTKGKNVRKEFRNKVKTERPPFTIPELRSLFAAPIFRGCTDDNWHANQPGDKQPRRGKFWIPLMSLFHGARLNELCQLYAQDIKEEDGIHYFHIRTEFDDEDATERRIKTPQSRRKVPIHSELIRLGFLEFVKQRNKDGENPRLFPEIVLGQATKRYSSAFSQWFARYRRSQPGGGSKATFHSFRHNFRTALSKAGVSIEYADTICGWGTKAMERNYFHADLKSLKAAIEKVTYPDLDISGLKVYVPEEVTPPDLPPTPPARVRPELNVQAQIPEVGGRAESAPARVRAGMREAAAMPLVRPHPQSPP